MRNLVSADSDAPHIHKQRSQQSGKNLIDAVADFIVRNAYVVAAVAGLLTASNLACAADLSPPLEPVPNSWTGLYIGGNAGYAGAAVDESVSGGGGSGNTSIPGFVAGGQIGGNYQVGSIVFGLEADFDGSTNRQSSAIGIVTGREQIPWIATFRGRVGVALNRLLIYGTGGAAAIQLRSTVNAGDLGSTDTDATHGAWTVGGGLEFAISKSLSVRVEDLYVDTGRFDLGFVGPVTVSGRVRENLVRAGLNYRLPVAW